jgi:hypothetical protein
MTGNFLASVPISQYAASPSLCPRPIPGEGELSFRVRAYLAKGEAGAVRWAAISPGCS